MMLCLDIPFLITPIEVFRGIRDKGAETMAGELPVPELGVDLLNTGGHGDDDPLVKQVARWVEGVETEDADERPGGLAQDCARHLLVETELWFVSVTATIAAGEVVSVHATLGVEEVDDGDTGVDVVPPVGERAGAHSLAGLKVAEDALERLVR
jgi:hypothetical protein